MLITDINKEKARAYLHGVYMAILGIYTFPEIKVSEAQLECAKEFAKKYIDSEIDKATSDSSQREILKQQWREWADNACDGFKQTLKTNNRLY